LRGTRHRLDPPHARRDAALRHDLRKR
jgi:hypothetical protein